MRVLRTNDVAAAVGLLGRAVALLPSGTDRAELQWERAIALRLRDRPDEADDALRAQRVTRLRPDRRGFGPEWSASRRTSACPRATFRSTKRSRRWSGKWPICRRPETAAGSPGPRSRSDPSTGSRPATRSSQPLQNAQSSTMPPRGSPRADASQSRRRRCTTAPVPVADALLRCSDLLERSPDRAAEAAVTAVLGGLRGLEGNCDDGRMLLAHARSLYEEVGNQSALLTTWSSLFSDVESIAGNHAAAEAEARSSIEALQVTGGRCLRQYAGSATGGSAARPRPDGRGGTLGGPGREGSARIGRPRAVLVAQRPRANPRAPRPARGGRGAGPGCRGDLLPHRRHPATAHGLTLRSPRSSPWPPSGHPPGQKQRRRGSSCARRAPRPCSNCTGRRCSPAAERKRSSEWSSSCLTAVRYRRCRHHHRAASAWRTSFRAPTVGGAPNGAVTTP